MATPGIVGERHYGLAQKIRRTLAQYAELKDIIAMLGLEQLSPEDRNVVARARRLERFLTSHSLRRSSLPASKANSSPWRMHSTAVSESWAMNSKIPRRVPSI